MDLSNIDFEAIGQFMLLRAWRLLVIAILSFVAYRALLALINIISHRIQQLDGEEDSEFDFRVRTVFRFVRSLGIIIIAVVAIIMLLSEAGVDTTPIIASVGVVGLAVGLGAQTLVKDALGGLFIVMEDQFHVGDAISINGTAGSVEAVNLRTTHLRDLSGTLHIIPNGDIRTVSNYTREWARAVIDVTIPYTENVELALETMREVLAYLELQPSFAGMIAEPLNVTGIEGFDENGMKFRVIGKVNAGQQWGVMRIIRRHLHEAFAKRDIQFATPMRRVLTLDAHAMQHEPLPETMEPLFPDFALPTAEQVADAVAAAQAGDDGTASLSPFQKRLVELRRWAKDSLINPDD